MLNIGSKAPNFELMDQNGVIHTLDQYKGKKILLYFYPKDNTPGCSAQACGYNENINKYKELDVVVLGVSKDSVASHKKFEANYNLGFTILSDIEKKAIEAYDVWGEKKMCGKTCMGVIRTTYLIDENGIIIKANNKVKTKTDALDMLKEI